MAKLGMQMLPGGGNQNLESEDEWSSHQQTFEQTSNIQALQQNQIITESPQALAAKQALILQNQQLQQQIALQNQLIQQAQAAPQPISTNQQQQQLSLYKNPTPIYMYPSQSTVIDQNPQPSNQEIPSIIQTKLELINEKLDQIKSITHLNNQNMPNMETNVLLQNIQRIVKENEQYKKDLYDKSAKIEELNAKITDLLMKAQNYVEQSHQILELKNNSYQSTAEKSQYRILELEQDKMKLTNELTQLTSQISELNLEVNRLRKEDLEVRNKLTEVSKNTDSIKQNSDRLLVENADLQTKLDTVLTELKKERHLKKTNETKLQLNEEELNELKANLTNSQKLIEEKRES